MLHAYILFYSMFHGQFLELSALQRIAAAFAAEKYLYII